MKTFSQHCNFFPKNSMGFTKAITGYCQGFFFIRPCAMECRVMCKLLGIGGQIVGVKQSLVGADVQSSMCVHQ